MSQKLKHKNKGLSPDNFCRDCEEQFGNKIAYRRHQIRRHDN